MNVLTVICLQWNQLEGDKETALQTRFRRSIKKRIKRKNKRAYWNIPGDDQ